jgi:diguanylate cyclase (GGDEF)-like protein
MTIDEPTLMAVLGLTALAASAVFFVLSVCARQIAGVRFWGVGCLLVGFATLVDAPRLITDWRLASLLFNIPFSVGQAFILAGTLQFCGRPGALRILWVLGTAAAVLTVCFTFLMPDTVWRIGSLSAIQTVTNLWACAVFWKYPDSAAPGVYRLAAGVALLQACAVLGQGVLVLGSTAQVSYAAPELPLANIISWAGAMLNILLGNWICYLLILLRLVADLRMAAERDVLTGLLNRRGLRLRIDSILRRAGGRGALGILLLDIDYFKAINDTHGHQVGDQVLVAMGEVLLALNAPNATVCRWGGEEFCVVVEGATRANVLALADKVRARFTQRSAALDALESGITVSIGIATATMDACFEMSALIGAADAQLYRAKLAGRDRVAMAA